MKKLIFTSTAVLTLILIVSCGGPKMNHPLLGKWKLKEITLPKVDLTSNLETSIDSAGIKGVDTAVKAMANGMQDMTNALTDIGSSFANAFLKGSVYEFKDNGEVEVSLMLGSQKGKYTISPDNKSVTTTIDSKEEKYTVKEVSADKLVLTSGAGEEWNFDKKD